MSSLYDRLMTGPDPRENRIDTEHHRVHSAICRVCEEDCDDLALDVYNDEQEELDWEDRAPEGDEEVTCTACKLKEKQ